MEQERPVEVAVERWSVEQVLAVAPSPGAVAVAEAFTDAARWSATGADDRSVWGRCRGSSREPYDTAVDHVGVGWRCSCPSRARPCKHALALLLRWVRGEIGAGAAPPAVAAWIDRRAVAGLASAGSGASPTTDTGSVAERPSAAPRPSGGAGAPESPGAPTDRDASRDERVARMRAGLAELDRWLEDRMRTGLTDPSLARFATWDELAARLVDARVGGLANRVRRLAGLVGAGPDWHERVLAELGLLHLLAQGGLRLTELPDGRQAQGGFDDGRQAQGGFDDGRQAQGGSPDGGHTRGRSDEPAAALDLGDLAGAVALAAGWQVRQAEVLAGVPETDEWVVAGRSDTREDRIEVRRTWLWGRATRRWAMVLSFAAYGQGLDDSLPVGAVRVGDLFRYPGSGLRALLAVGQPFDDAASRTGAVSEPLDVAGPEPLDVAIPEPLDVAGPEPLDLAGPEPLDVVGACLTLGDAIAVEPWVERLAVTVLAAPTVADGRWVLTDATGSLPLIGEESALATLVAASLGAPVPVTVEWTPFGVLPLTVHRPGRAIDIGPRADPSFVGSGR